MMHFIAEQNVLLYAMGVIGVLGAISQILLYGMYTHLIKDMEHTMAPKGKFMKQLRQRYGGYQRMNEGMRDVSVFVKKSLMEYRCLGMNLHQWRRAGGVAFVLCMCLGVAGYYVTGLYQYAEPIRRNYLLGTIASILLFGGIYGLTDIGYKRKYLQVGLENLLNNMGISRNLQTQTAECNNGQVQDKNLKKENALSQNLKEEINRQTAASKEMTEKKGPIYSEVSGKTSSISKRKRSKMAETQAQKDKRELKENLAKLKEGISETAVSEEGKEEKEQNAQVLRQMNPEDQERIMREVLKEFLS